nr:sodium:proton antiporter [Dorea formicigenerans]
MASTICFLLLCIAVMPLLRAEWWEAHQPLVVFMWIILLVVPFAIVYGAGDTFETVLECIVNDYLTFIVLLFGLFCVSGNITVGGDFAGSPRVNACLLALGTLLSSCIGTTGASMLMVRPVIKMNSWRKRKRHIMVFFIFLISNMGGCLTPIGDPPLLMGFMRGVPFFWSMHLLPILIFNLVILLFVFYHLDKKAYRKDIAEGRKPDISRPGTEFYIEGLHNIILLAAFLSFKTTDSSIRTKNHFTWGAIKEVAVLFIGIFITMQPALMLLKSVGPNLGISEPYQMFWATGTLFSFLDNTPTYLVFLTTAGTLGLTGGITTALGQIPVNLLEAISCGAVFMGANTYIGNAPNFMVKAISDENGVNMPSFFGYILWSLAFLVPVFILDMLVFFL